MVIAISVNALVICARKRERGSLQDVGVAEFPLVHRIGDSSFFGSFLVKIEVLLLGSDFAQQAVVLESFPLFVSGGRRVAFHLPRQS